MIEKIERLILQSRLWMDDHHHAGRHIEAMACAIRIRALQQALDIVRDG